MEGGSIHVSKRGPRGQPRAQGRQGNQPEEEAERRSIFSRLIPLVIIANTGGSLLLIESLTPSSPWTLSNLLPMTLRAAGLICLSVSSLFACQMFATRGRYSVFVLGLFDLASTTAAQQVCEIFSFLSQFISLWIIGGLKLQRLATCTRRRHRLSR